MVPWNPARVKVQLRLAVQRLRTLEEKSSVLAKKSRRDIAELLEKGKIETARIRVEAMINDDIYLELLELLELYSELLLARFGILDQNNKTPDPAVAEGVYAVIYAAPRTELKELHVLREMLMHRYGRELSIDIMANKDNIVTERVTSKLALYTPSSELVDAYLLEIAKGYSINWTPPSLAKAEEVPEVIEEDKVEAPVEPSSAPPVKVPVVKDQTPPPKLPDAPSTVDDSIPEKAPPPYKKPTNPQSKASSGNPVLPPAPQDDDLDDLASLANRLTALRKR